MKLTGFSNRINNLAEKVLSDIRPQFEKADEIARINSLKVLNAFADARVSAACFGGSTGYGYTDPGRDAIEKIYAQSFGAEAALVRTTFVNGTHAISTALFAALKPGEKLCAVTGLPYDTLQGVIGITGNYPGSLKYYGIGYTQVDLLPDGSPDFDGIKNVIISDKAIKACQIQRSRGYSSRPALTIEQIWKICDIIHNERPDIAVITDNCYGEFVDIKEPASAGSDLTAGSLIKNPGGGLAPTGGYIVGRKDLVEAASYRLTTPGIGAECGATLDTNRLLLQGFFVAPHVVSQAMKTAVFCAGMMTELGFETYPAINDIRSDIIQTVYLKSPEMLTRFCRGIQSGAPIDAFVSPEAWDMPGYESKVIMAAGAFNEGASIELSADGPMREPYCAYVQGGITFESGMLGIMRAAEMLIKE